MRRPVVLFMAEAVTLAHVARPLALAEGLDPDRYEVVFASDSRFGCPWQGQAFEHRTIRSIPSEHFLGALARGRPVYDVATLESYIAEDLKLLREIKPDVVVGDFRLSLSVSARLAGVPFWTITNAYWSPYAEPSFPMPELPLSRALGIPIAKRFFTMARPIAFALHAQPLNRVRRNHGLPSLGPDLRRIYTDSDLTLYADVPEMVPTLDLPPTHHYLGPISWTPRIEPPPWWDEIPDDRPTLYATLGSSGRPELLTNVLAALADLPVVVLAASAGKPMTGPVPSNVRHAAYLPGREAADRSRVVLCNGGSPTTHQALSAGTPVLGLAGNMDQHLNMRGVVAQDAGILIRSEKAQPRAIRKAVETMLSGPIYRESARSLAAILAQYDAHHRFRMILDQWIRTPSKQI